MTDTLCPTCDRWHHRSANHIAPKWQPPKGLPPRRYARMTCTCGCMIAGHYGDDKMCTNSVWRPDNMGWPNACDCETLTIPRLIDTHNQPQPSYPGWIKQ